MRTGMLRTATRSACARVCRNVARMRRVKDVEWERVRWEMEEQDVEEGRISGLLLDVSAGRDWAWFDGLGSGEDCWSTNRSRTGLEV